MTRLSRQAVNGLFGMVIDNENKPLGRNSQNFLRQIHEIFVTLRCFYGVIIHRKKVLCDF